MNKLVLNEIARVKQLMNINESLGGVTFRKYNAETDFKTIFSRLTEVYGKLGDAWSSDLIWSNIAPVNEELSVVAEVDGELAGFYFLNDEPIIPGGDEEIYEELSKLTGIEGVALGVFSEYKNLGIGKMLIEYPKNLGFDYIWGYQLKALDNINDWLKRRKIYVQTPGLYVTYQIFKDNEESISN